MKKGFLLTFDALLSILPITLIMLLVISQDYRDGTFASLQMRSFSMGMMTSFEKTGLFAQAASGNTSALRVALNSLPQGVCANIVIADSANATVAEAAREGCDTPQSFYVFYRTFYSNGELYLAKSQAWSRA